MGRIHIPAHYVLYSTTDLQGNILTASDDFIAVSGYQRHEMIGQPHNLIRHPLVPKKVFADMWATLKAGKSWSATVVNRAKSGDEYWVVANASPIKKKGKIVGYVSVRRPADNQEIEQALALYKAVEQGDVVLKNAIVRHKWDMLFDSYRNLPVFKKLMLPMLLIFTVGSTIVYDRITVMLQDALNSAGTEAATDMITMAKNARQFYMDAIIPKVKAHGMQLSHNYASHPTNLPLAANVMMALGEMSKAAGKEGEVGEVRLFSNYPFKFRGDAKLDDFERQALAALAADPKTPFIRIEKNESGQSFLRMAVPDIMTQQACINCHNSDPNSVKTDWKVGDVRGAVSAKIPLGSLQNAISKPVMELIWVLIFVALMLLLVIYAVMYSIKQRLQRLQSSVYQVEETGNFSLQTLDKGADEIGQTIDVFNMLQNQILASIVEVAAATRAIVQGNFDAVSSLNVKGSFKRIVDSLNEAAQSLDNTLQELSKVMDGLYQGQFDVKMNDQVPESFRNKVNMGIQSIATIMADITAVMAKMQDGDFSTQVSVEARGELLALKNSINATLETIADAITQISETVSAQAAGDLTVGLPSRRFKGELHDLKNAINYSLEKMRSVVEVVSDAAIQVNYAANELAGGVEQLNHSMQEQAAAVEQTSATMEQMTATIEQNTENTKTALNLAMQVEHKAKTGTEVMERTIGAIQAIKESSYKITEIVGLIDGIAFQTNLLALNAAVEAARAGEHGRGFAVVAGEVRALAAKSADAAKDIKQLIDESVQRIEQGTKMVDTSGEALQDIMRSIEQVTEVVTHITKATEEQAIGIAQVNNAISTIDKMTQQNASSAAVIAQSSESAKAQSDRLAEEMAFFKT